MHGKPKYDKDFTHLDYVNPDAPKGGTLRQSQTGSFDSLNPYAIKGSAAHGLQLYYDRLMARVWDEPFTMYPLIAEKVIIPDDRSQATFILNPKARFHDGSPITAEDVLFSFETLRDYGRPNMRRVYKLVSEAKIIDDHTIHFAFGAGYDEETVMIFSMMPVLSKSWWKDRSFDAATLEPPLSSGPYMIDEIDPGRRIIYKRNPDYWGKDLPVNVGHYNFDRIIYDYFRDDVVALQAFKSGDIDFRREMNAGKWATQYTLPNTQTEIIKEELSHGRPEQVRSLIFNTRRPPFDVREVRHALSLVLDFNWLNSNLFHDKYKRIESFFPNSMLAAQGKPDEAELALLLPWQDTLPQEVFGQAWTAPQSNSQQEWRVILRQADALLKQAGWIVKDGVRVRAENASEKLEFEILLGSPEDEKMIIHYVRALERLGVKAKIRVLDAAAFQGRLTNYDFDMVNYFWNNSLSPGTEQMLYWSCEAAKQNSRWNYAGICTPATEALITGIATSKDYTALTAHAHALDRVLTWGFYTVPLYYTGKDYVAYRSFIHRPQTTPVYGLVLETWWAEPQNETGSQNENNENETGK